MLPSNGMDTTSFSEACGTWMHQSWFALKSLYHPQIYLQQGAAHPSWCPILCPSQSLLSPILSPLALLACPQVSHISATRVSPTCSPTHSSVWRGLARAVDSACLALQQSLVTWGPSVLRSPPTCFLLWQVEITIKPVLRNSLEVWDGVGGGGDICIPIADSYWCMAETTTIL